MRKELNLAEAIDKYLGGQMNPDEKTSFEKRIQTEPALQKEVELQKEVLKGIERAGLKQSAKQGMKKYKFGRNLKNWGLTGLAVAVLAVSSVFLYNSVIKGENENAPQELPELNEKGEKLWSDADKYLKLQSFEINAEKDTVIESTDGIVFAIPANCFLDASGNPVKGNIQVEIKEALKASDIMKAGLNTRSGDKLLETGGMFYVNARKGDASLTIDPKNALYAEIPTDEVKPGMQLFEGKRLADGSIDWVNPKPMAKDLIPVDIFSLNFYPPKYLDSLKSFGYNSGDKKFTDSLYYSFASLFEAAAPAPTRLVNPSSNQNIAIISASVVKGTVPLIVSFTNVGQGTTNIWNFEDEKGITVFSPTHVYTKPGIYNASLVSTDAKGVTGIDNIRIEVTGNSSLNGISSLSNQASRDTAKKLFDYVPTDTTKIIKVTGINPASIKTIWSADYQNTLLSTREFEERLQTIFGTCDQNILNLYINSLEQNMSSIDSTAYSISGKKKFLDYAARNDGKVKNGNKNVEQLKAYYQQRTKLYTEAIAKTVNEFWNEHAKKDMEVLEKTEAQAETELARTTANFMKEFDLNLKDAYRQLGKKPSPIPPATYGTPIIETGWKNVDQYVAESTITRTTLNYTDPVTAKKAVIRYEPLTVSVKDSQNYDRLLVYLLPDALNSFMRVNNTNGAFTEKLNELMIYKMVCIGYKGEESFYFSQDNVKPGSLSVSLIKTSNGEITDNVNKLSKRSQSKAMNDELAYMAFEKEEAKRQKAIAKINDLTNKIRPVIFPCATFAVADTVMSETMNFNY